MGGETNQLRAISHNRDIKILRTTDDLPKEITLETPFILRKARNSFPKDKSGKELVDCLGNKFKESIETGTKPRPSMLAYAK